MGRLSLGALGLALVTLVSAAWGTGLFYLLARLGYGSPVRLASLDGIHVYVGVVGSVFIVAKISRVGFRYRVEGVPGVVQWHRWMSWSLLALYSAVFVTGALALVPIPGRAYTDLVDLHLLTSVWALLPTTWHVWHYRARALPYLRRWLSRAAGRRFWAGLVLVALPAPLLVGGAVAVSQLPRVGAGTAWTPAGLQGDYLDTVTRLPDGTIVAAGDALYVSRDGVIWIRVDLPVGGGGSSDAGPPAAGPGGAPSGHAGHEHGAPAPPNSIVALGITSAGQVLAGTARGLYSSAGLTAPLLPVPFPGGAVRALAVDPADGRTLWAASAGGPYVSEDGGRTWTRQAAGLTLPDAASAVAYLGRQVFLSDTTGVFRWPPGGPWLRTSSQPDVTVLAASANGRLYASSASGSDVWVFANDRWSNLGSPTPVHNHGGHLHGGAGPITDVAGVLYAAATSDGVSASDDRGRTWTQLGGGLASVTAGAVLAVDGGLVAATSDGLYGYALAAAPSASPGWWLALLALAVGIGLVAVVVGGLGPPARGSRWRRRGDGSGVPDV